jgi:hypothetical protein
MPSWPNATLLIRKQAHDPCRKVERQRQQIETLVATAAQGHKPTEPVELPTGLTVTRLSQVFRRMNATTRHSIYMHMRKVVRMQRRPLTKQQLVQIAESARRGDIRESVCKLYDLQKLPDDRYSCLMRRAYYTFMMDPEFARLLDADKADNDKLLTVIFEGWVIPDMDKPPAPLSEDQLQVPPPTF